MFSNCVAMCFVSLFLIATYSYELDTISTQLCTGIHSCSFCNYEHSLHTSFIITYISECWMKYLLGIFFNLPKNPQKYFLDIPVTFSMYSVMQSYGNSFGGDVVSDIFNKTFRDIPTKYIFKSRYVRIIFVVILILYNNIQKCILTKQ